MSADWEPDEFKDEFKDEILRLVERKVKAGQTETVTQPEPEEGASERGGAKIIDLTELLQRSLRGKGGAKKAAAVQDDDDEDEEPALRPRPPAKKRKPAAKAASKTPAKAKPRARRAA
jgi:DNA end-binding protein Ku